MISCPCTPESNRKKRLSYLPSSPDQRRSQPFEITPSPSASPLTPTHRLRPIESSSPASLSWTDESPKCLTPNTPRRRIAALLEATPVSTNKDNRKATLPSILLDPCTSSSPGRKRMSNNNNNNIPWSDTSSLTENELELEDLSPKRQMSKSNLLDDPLPSPCSTNSSSTTPSRRRKPKLSLLGIGSSPSPSPKNRKQKATLAESLLPPLLHDSFKMFELSWRSFPDLSNNTETEEVEPVSKSIVSVVQAKEHVEKVNAFVKEQKRYSMELSASTKRFQKVAVARLTGGSETGAILAMKKIHKIKLEQERVSKAVQLAKDAIIEIECEINNAQREQGKSNRRPGKIDLKEHMNVLEDAEAILSERPRIQWDTQQLLESVRSLDVLLQSRKVQRGQHGNDRSNKNPHTEFHKSRSRPKLVQ